MRQSLHPIAFAFSLVVLGCSSGPPGKSVVTLTVSASAPVAMVDRLRATVMNAGMTAQPLEFPLGGPMMTIPPERTIALVFAADRSGPADILVEALDSAGMPRSKGNVRVTVGPGASITGQVVLGVTSAGDGTGKPCKEDKDCPDGVCYLLFNGKVCTKYCKDATTCVPGWTCDFYGGPGDKKNICGCKQGGEVCDGKDNDCNGLVDDGAAVEKDCASKGTGFRCKAGACACALMCGGTCVDANVDAANCGTCGTACSKGAKCEMGVCKCPMAQMVCSGTCTDLMTDRLNCGACGKACAVGQGCQMGMCVAQPCTCISLGGNGEIKATPAPDNHYWPGGAITIEAWVRPAGMSVGNGALISSGPYTFKIPALTPRFDFSTVRGMPGVGGGALTVGRWSHLAVVWDGTAAVTFFQDGKRHSSNMVPKDELTPVSGKIPMVIGSLNSAAFNGWVSEVRLSKVARYTMDFQPTARFTADADTLALFHLAEVGASNAQDSSSLMSHGTIDSAVWAQGCPP